MISPYSSFRSSSRLILLSAINDQDYKYQLKFKYNDTLKDMNQQDSVVLRAVFPEFMDRNMSDKQEMVTTDIDVKSTDELVLTILGTLKAMLGVIPYKAEKIADRVEFAGYYMPLYKFTKEKTKRGIR